MMINSQLPPVLDIRITGICNMTCPYCFGPRHNIGHVDVCKLKPILSKLPNYGVRRIVVTGGEPTLVKELPLLLRAAKDVNLKIVLSTNGLTFHKRMEEIAPFIDWIGLPLDGNTPENNALIRKGNNKQFYKLLELIPLIKKTYPQIKIKLGTVVCSVNKDSISDIGKLFNSKVKPDIWKLYQVNYRSYGYDNRQELELSDDEFEHIVKRTEVIANKKGVPLIAYYRKQLKGNYLFLEPNGDAMVVNNSDEIVIGNFFNDIDHVIHNWKKYVNINQMLSNYSMTYPEED